MTLQSIFEQNRERLMSAVQGAETGSAVRALNAELDRILYTFNDEEENARVREAASSMIQVAKASCSLVDSAGDTKIYGRTDYGEAPPARSKMPTWGLMLLILGLVAAAVTVIGMQLLATAAAKAAHDWQSAGLPPRSLMAAVPLVAAAALFFAGMAARRRKAPSKERLHTETKVDAVKVYNHLLSMVLVMDKCLEDVRNAAKQEENERLKDQVSAMDPAELELLAQLLENAYSRRAEDEQAGEEISQIRFYLHQKNIDVVDWDAKAEKQGSWFDMMPAFKSGTIRPALVSDGKLLKKGLASAR